MGVSVSAMCGSLRAGSFNQGLLDAAIERASGHGLTIVQARIDRFPLFDQDRENEPPQPVLEAKRIVAASRCLLLATPEADYGVPGVLKNAIGWLSRPSGDPTLRGRSLALMGVSTGRMGTIRGQLAWRQLWHYFNAPVFSEVELTVPMAAGKFEGTRLVDPETIGRLDDFLERLAGWLAREQSSAGSGPACT